VGWLISARTNACPARHIVEVPTRASVTELVDRNLNGLVSLPSPSLTGRSEVHEHQSPRVWTRVDDAVAAG
jgi:hypothetical protein